MLLAGDVGGTKTLLGLFERDRAAPASGRGPSIRDARLPRSAAMIAEFLDGGAARGAAIDAGCFGVAGPGDRRCRPA